MAICDLNLWDHVLNAKLNIAAQSFILWWLQIMCRQAKLVVSVGLVATVAIFYYTVTNIGINTDTEDMLSPDLPFRKNSAALSDAFPQNSDNIVIVLDGPNPDQLRDAAIALKERLAKSPELFGEVFDPIGHPFFGQNGFLYFDEDELSDLIDRLTQAQPFLGKLWASLFGRL